MKCNHRLQDAHQCETCTRQDWKAYRDDYRCTRSAVTCEGCGTHYPRGKDEGNATYIGYALKTCGNCERLKRYAEIRKVTARISKRIDNWIATRDAGNRKVHRDIACRYIERYQGETFAVQTEIDDCKIYLRNANGKTIAEVLSTDRYPKLPSVTDFHEIPY